jgi:hypothetical protein
MAVAAMHLFGNDQSVWQLLNAHMSCKYAPVTEPRQQIVVDKMWLKILEQWQHLKNNVTTNNCESLNRYKFVL